MIRKFACLAAAALALASLPALAATPDRSGAEKLGWKLTLQTWTVHDTVYHSIDIAHELGVRYLDVYPGQQLSPDDKGKFQPGMTDEEIKAVLDKAKASDVEIIDYGVTGIPNNEVEARKIFDWAKKLGLTTLVTEPDPNALPLIDRLAGEYHMKVGIHDHPVPDRYAKPDYVYSLIKDLKNVGFTADIGHWKRSGFDPVDVLKKYGERVVSVHFKDLVPGGGDHNLHDVVWGTGDNRAADVLQVLKDKGFRGPIAIEYEWKWDVPTLQKCVDFFFNQANKLAAE